MSGLMDNDDLVFQIADISFGPKMRSDISCDGHVTYLIGHVTEWPGMTSQKLT